MENRSEENDLFEEVPSAVAGVTLFRQKSRFVEESGEAEVEFHCPDCDAPV